MPKHVAVLMGGWGSESEVSLASGKACAKALREIGYKVTEVLYDRSIAKQLEAIKPDIVFNALHGRWGEDGCIQGLLNILDIPYTHSGVLASAVAMDKKLSSHLLTMAGLNCPPAEFINVDQRQAYKPQLPCVAKPIQEGSSVGVSILQTPDDWQDWLQKEWVFGNPIMIEPYIPGKELTVAVLGDQALSVTELRPRQGFYDYRNKYTHGCTDHLIPAPVPQIVFDLALDQAKRAHQTLGCRGVSRSDFRFDDTNLPASLSQDEAFKRLFILEVNTQPGMTELSLVPEQATHIGLSMPELVRRLVEEARCD